MATDEPPPAPAAPAAAPASPEALLLGLGDARQIQRERSKLQLDMALKQTSKLGEAEREAMLTALEAAALHSLGSEAWSQRLGGLTAAKALMQLQQRRQAFEHQLQPACLQLLEDDEVRVRLAVGDCLEVLAQLRGAEVLEACMERVMSSIHLHYDREGEGSKRRGQGGADGAGSEDGDSGPASPTASGPNSRNSSVGDLIGMLLQSSYKVTKPGTGELRHGSEGWMCLETSCRALGLLLEGAGDSCRPWLTQDFITLIARSQHHPNRFIREVSHFTIKTICCVLRGPDLAAAGPTFVQQLADGLSDNWSQVRYAASVGTRSFLEHVPKEGQDPFLPVILPPMCLNRYYEAEGVRRYSQQTWMQVMGEEGRAKVAACIQQVVAYYINQTKSSHHGVREAACTCIAELMEKIDCAAVAPHVNDLLHALTLCFKDMGWPVRDAACTAFGRCVLSHPRETWPVLEKELWVLWQDHLWDNIPSVRRNTAAAIGNALRSYGQKALDQVAPVVRDMLPRAMQQACDQQGRPDAAAGAGAEAGVSGRSRDNDHKLHSDQEMFSCTTLSSRMGRDFYMKSDGCMDYGFTRERELWEASDGALHLVEQLALQGSSLPLPAALDLALDLLPCMADLGELRSFRKACSLRETLWKVLPAVARSLGKQRFKAHLPAFLQPMLGDLTSDNQLTAAAAGRCVVSMRQLLGKAIFEARLAPEQQELVRSNLNVVLAEEEVQRLAAAAACRPAGQ